MTRTLTSGVQTAIDSPTYRDVYFVSLHYDEEVERICSAPFSVWFDDDGDAVESEFVGVGALGNISSIEEGSELRAYGITIGLTGVDPAQLAIALNTRYQGRLAKVWLGFLENDYTLIDTPVLVFSGMMDTMPIELSETATINLTIENVMARWENPNPRNQRYTSADQQDVYPGDLFFEFSSSVPARELVWGRS